MRQMSVYPNIKCVDLFCGAGGLTHGLKQANINVVAGYDVDSDCRFPYERNNGAVYLERDVAELSVEELQGHYRDAEVKVLAGCAPCQPFSTYSHRYETIGTPRWGLLYQFAKLVRELSPEIVTMENVSSVVRHKVFDDFLMTLEGQGYHLFHGVINCADYGLAQTRRRTVLLASLMGPIELSPSRAMKRTVRHAIGSLPTIEAGGADPRDPLHASSTLSPLNMQRMKASVPGGTWRDWPPHLVAECHRKPTGKTYPGVYARMSWDQPSPTLTTQFFGFGNGRYGHPEQDRAISLREGAILQGFPKGYAFLPEGGPIHFKKLGRMIGNAVPVTLGKLIGKSIKKHLDLMPVNSESSAAPVGDDQAGNSLVA